MNSVTHASLALARTHYENFPVASVLLPWRLRRPISLIYAFARKADDIADEGDALPAQRLAQLDEMRRELDLIGTGVLPSTPFFVTLGDTIAQHRLPLQPFYDLLDAFGQDVIKQRYADFGEVMDYCRRSANPIGRLLLHLYGEASPRNLGYADAICSALQIINFLQDVAIDYRKGRIYLPEEDLRKFRIEEAQIARGDADSKWQALMHFEIERARRLLQSGAPLGLALKGRIGLEMRMIIAGGETILRKLHKAHGDMFNQRPVLRPWDWTQMLYKAVRAR